MKRRFRQQRRLRTSLAALSLALSVGLAMPAARAAESLVFVSGAFRRSIQVADLEWLAKTGEPRGLMADVLRFSNQDPAVMAALLNQSITLPVTLMSRLLNTRIGEALLSRLAQVIFPLKASEAGLPALRSALVMGTVKGDGSLSAISFLRAYPTRELQVDIPALLALIDKASSVTELVRFFSESPLDGLRNGNSAQPSQAEP
jgi:Alpha/beta hydrolase of unknown function (DUF1400).